MARKIVLAYSGGLDTSVILVWLKERFKCDVIAFLADIGQGEDLAQAADKARRLGAVDVVIEDLREEFARDYVFAMLRGNALYEGRYMLGTAIARPLIAKAHIDCARRAEAEVLSHGATGKGNDQMRFELAYAALAPDLEVVAPWRIWDMKSRADLLRYAEAHQIAIEDKIGAGAPFSIDANLLHRSSEGNELEDIARPAPETAYQLTAAPEAAADKAREIELAFEAGNALKLDGKVLSAAGMLEALNEIGGAAAIGRIDMVESRATGMKSRGIYETPGGTILLTARRLLEEITLDGHAQRLKDQLMPIYADLIYRGFWFSPEREMLQALIDKSQEYVSGQVALKLYKGNITPVSRKSEASLYDQTLASFEDGDTYSHQNAEGFIRLAALRLLGWHRQRRSRQRR